jgi:hypothetical protein
MVASIGVTSIAQPYNVHSILIADITGQSIVTMCICIAGAFCQSDVDCEAGSVAIITVSSIWLLAMLLIFCYYLKRGQGKHSTLVVPGTSAVRTADLSGDGYVALDDDGETEVSELLNQIFADSTE